MVFRFYIPIIFGFNWRICSLRGELMTLYAKIYHKDEPENKIHERNEPKEKPPERLIPLGSNEEKCIEHATAPRPSLLRNNAIGCLIHVGNKWFFDLENS